MAAANKKLYVFVLYTKKIFQFLLILNSLCYVNFFLLLTRKKKNQSKLFLKIYPFFYKNILLFQKIKIISKPTKSFFISLKALKLISKRSDRTVILLSTSKGILTHSQALDRRISGFVFATIFI